VTKTRGAFEAGARMVMMLWVKAWRENRGAITEERNVYINDTVFGYGHFERDIDGFRDFARYFWRRLVIWRRRGRL
jgi:hypothetical protein